VVVVETEVLSTAKTVDLGVVLPHRLLPQLQGHQHKRLVSVMQVEVVLLTPP
jgi:NCAIR mutase (PurE)-related protein